MLSMEAQELRLHYDFSSVNGTTVADNSVSDVNATLRGSAKVETMGKYKVLNLGKSSGYLDLTQAAGKVFASLDNYTISVYYRVDADASLSGNGYFLWAFSTNSACSADAGIYSAYRLNAQRVATSTGGYAHESGIERGTAATKDVWTHVAFVQSGSNGRLYINGTLVGTTAMPANSGNFGSTTPAYCWIGRPPFSGDAYLASTLVCDFRLYDAALSQADIKTLAATTEDLAFEFRYGGEGDFTQLKAAVESAETYIEGINPTQFPPSAITEFQDAINIARFLIAEGKVNQATIDNCRSDLQAARTKFTATRGIQFDTSGITQGYDSDRGFIHPGGLHTEADFVRIRQQLAEGNELVTAAYQVLKTAEYSQSTCATWPSEAIVRGGDGQNYINAARGATIAYQNALRWKIDGTRANADAAVRTLMAWTNTTKRVTGTSDQSLAYGLYGYEFAQAAELMRDYEGWNRDDFHQFQRWMLDVWYPGCIGFLRGRNGTWENAGKWWQAPGHYWSNWGLCNALAVLSIGVLCDDIFIYNQGLSFIKYDQVGTFTDPRTADPILNDGLTEFWGNLIVTTAQWEKETGAYGCVGQMNESGRDTGHAAMALGLAVDIAHQLYNQGDDLFAFMNHRLAAGIEYIAAQILSIEGLPWTNYHYANNGYFYTDSRSWLMTGPALGAQMRPYWGTVIGHYEGVKGVEMPFAHQVYEQMGIDAGGLGSTSGGYDHLGYSVLMNTRDGLASTDKVPTELSGKMTYGGRTYSGNELGGLKNNYNYIANQGFQAGTTVELQPQLPDGETDTGLWRWNTGEQTRNITITASESRVYRVTYTNSNGVESYLVFTVAVQGDCQESTVIPYINGEETGEAEVAYGSSVTLSATCLGGFGSILWDNGQTDYTITIPTVTTSRTIRAIFTNQGGRKTLVEFRLNVQALVPNIKVGTVSYSNSATRVVDAGADVELVPTPAAAVGASGRYEWYVADELVSTDPTFQIESVNESRQATVRYFVGDVQMANIPFCIYVKAKSDPLIEPGNYLIHHLATDTYLTNTAGADASPSLRPLISANDATPHLTQVWNITRPSSARYDFMSLADSLKLNAAGNLVKLTARPLRITSPVGMENVQIYTSTGKYWTPLSDGTIDFSTETALTDYPFQLIPVELTSAIHSVKTNDYIHRHGIYNLQGQQLRLPARGLNIIDGKKVVVK